MNKLKSWRWQRIFQKETYQKEFDGGSFILLLTTAGLVLIASTEEAVVLFWGLIVVSIFFFLMYACTADDYFMVEKADGVSLVTAKVYVTKLKSGYKLVFEWPHGAETKVVDEYISSIWPSKVHNLLYRTEDRWYLINKYNEHPVLMGKRIGKNIFAFTYLNSSEVLLKILAGDNFTEFLVDSYSYGAEDLLTIEPSLPLIKSPQQQQYEFILLKKEGKYRLLACFSKSDSCSLGILEVKKAQAIVAKEGNNTLILVQDQGEYKILYSGPNFIRNIGLNVLTLYNTKGDLYGKMMHLNIENLTLDTVYDGLIYGINFDDGEIICERGITYVPKKNKFV